MHQLRDWPGTRILLRHATITGLYCNNFPLTVEMVDLTGSIGELGEDCKW